MRRKLFLLFIIFCFASGHFFAQDTHFSQLSNNPLITNPSNTGVFTGDIRAGTVFRKQWSSVSGFGADYQNMGAFVDGSFFKRKSRKGSFLGMGLMYLGDKAGDSKLGTTTISLLGNYVLSISHTQDKFISLGLDANYNQRSVKPDGLMWDNQWAGNHYDPSIPGELIELTSYSYMDFRIGGMFFYTGNEFKKYHIGGTFAHLLKPNITFHDIDNQKRKLTVHGGGSFGTYNSNKIFQPSFLLSKQGRHTEVTAGTYWKYVMHAGSKRTGFSEEKAISFGAWYRLRDAIILAIRYEFKRFNVGFSYDLNFSTFNRASNLMGGPEITILWKASPVKNKRAGQYKNVRYL